MKRRLASAAALLYAGVAALLAAAAEPQRNLAPVTGGSQSNAPSPWRVVGLPKQPAALALAQFEVLELDGQRSLRVRTQASYGTLLHEWQAPAGKQLAWRWRLDAPLANADIRTKAGDDAALKVCVMFDAPLTGVPLLERTMLRMARSITGEDLPAATLCYLWDNKYPAGTVSDNPYTRRVRYIVLQGAGAALGQWADQSRDVGQDFLRLFGEENSALPPVRAVLVGADADNTLGSSLGYLQMLRWQTP